MGRTRDDAEAFAVGFEIGEAVLRKATEFFERDIVPTFAYLAARGVRGAEMREFAAAVAKMLREGADELEASVARTHPPHLD